jgi:hypothetical protein
MIILFQDESGEKFVLLLLIKYDCLLQDKNEEQFVPITYYETMYQKAYNNKII